MKKILLSLLWIITLWLINFSSASFTTATQWYYTNWQNVSMSSLYNDFWEWFLCINLFYNANLNVFDSDWTQLYSSYISQDSTQVCFYNSWNYSFFSVYWWEWTYIYYIAWQSSCPSVNEICPNIKLNIVNLNDSLQWTWLYLTNYSSQNVWFSSIYYSWNLQFSQFNWSLLMTCPSADCSFFEDKLNICLDDYDILWQDFDNLQDSYNALSWYYNSCVSELSSCLSWSSPWTWDNWSALYINWIQHMWRSIIDVYIADEIEWDYSFDDTEFNLYVSWYNVDTEYIDNIIRTQNYKPTSEDFTELVLMLAPYSKIIIFCVFLFIVWAWIKKPFKSKKL